MKNFYQLLEISETASQAEIKAAFKRLAVLYHPDKHAGNMEMEERFKEINLAYQTLSNPYEKARYDIKLTYSRSIPNTEFNPPDTFSTQPRKRYYYRPNYKEPEIDWKENWIATAYAFGFTIIVACLVMTVIWIKTTYDEKMHQELLANRRATFESAQEDLLRGKVGDALVKLNDLSPHLPEENDMRDFKANLFHGYILKGQESYTHRQYQDAIYYFELIEKFSPRKPIPVKELLAKAYQENHQPHQSIKKFKELLVLGHNSLDYYLSMGEIYRDQINNPTEAIRYFQLARDKALRQYKSFYGDAYFLVLSADMVPIRHYELFTGLAELYLIDNQDKNVIKTTQWNIQVWPDSIDNYLVAAQAYRNIGQLDKSCKNLQSALILGANITLPPTCIPVLQPDTQALP
ncbi:DnaJ domain-containing protein [Marinoscillum sp. MHG1-6]|uniref:J domain-containing protein n=1 Tax=Marinoscillum sp. MHG1-6 TaxID=2959627 RepID=UPI002157167A|nr:DnaJ domain-containing protein [Marinoscillum sp. MHG1-6]